MTKLSEIYNARIVELAARIPPARHLASPDATATAHSKLCGSTITVELALADGRISDYAATVKACLLGQAAASIVAAEIIGSTARELADVTAVMRRMLKEGGPPPAGRWSDLAILEPVKDYKARHTSTLLVFEAVEKALAAAAARPDAARALPHSAA